MDALTLEHILKGTMSLTSRDYMQFIGWLALTKYNRILSKTQMQKILFICYGLYLAKHGTDHPLFSDDSPKAWPFGPVFPIVYRRYAENPSRVLPDAIRVGLMQDPDNLKEMVRIVDYCSQISSGRLSVWSHRKGSPWEQTVFANGKDNIEWNKAIDKNLIAEFFKDESKWMEGLQ